MGATPPEPAPLAEQPPISQGTEPAPEPSWRREPDRSVEELKASREREDREDETRAETAEPAFEASIADALDEGPAELQAGELEAQEEGPEEEGKAETRKKRPRRSRRGRKNGRSATASPETAEDEEDDEDREEPAHEVPAPPPLPSPRRQPAHMAVAPAPSPAPRPVRAPEPAWVPAPTTDFERLAREIIISVPERQRGTDERKIAMFCDLENIALGVRDSEIGKFDINLILERLLEKGKIIVKKAYADWERYSDYKRPFHEAAIELIDIPQKFYSGKNSADIKMVVDAMDLSYSKEHLDTFVILSGDSDFSPLVSKLKENNKYVIGVGVKNSSSNLLIDNCDEFLYYEDVWRDNQKGPKLDGLNKKTAEVFSLMIESIQALLRENKDVLWGSMIKQTMQRKKPSFNEGYYGYTTFSELLEDAERKNILKLKKDQRSGTYIVIGFASRTEPVPAARR
ncbi:MAG TPA: NYN domain-containing protein [Thermoanaerobaculia bacterium]